MIALVTDSASQIPPSLAERFGVRVAPVGVTMDGVAYREGADLTADEFWHRFSGGALPDVSTSQPSPGEIVGIYREIIAAGAEEIVSVHVAADQSGTVNSARLAAEMVDVPVHIIDSGTASFGVSCCVWEAASVIDAGGSAAAVVARVEAVRPTIGTVFIIQALEFAQRGGRLAQDLPAESDGVMVLSGFGTDFEVIAVGHTVEQLCDQMAAPFIAEGRPIRAGVCLADEATLPFTEGIEARLRDSHIDVDLVRYRVGPSIAAHTGPGTAGGFWYPIDA